MKKNIHPNYREVVFEDTSTGFTFLTRSTVETNYTTVWGVDENSQKEYPLAKVDVSSESHPFYTGGGFIAKAKGEVEKFNNRYKKK
jgi:large subunit ribosomal protein L31